MFAEAAGPELQAADEGAVGAECPGGEHAEGVPVPEGYGVHVRHAGVDHEELVLVDNLRAGGNAGRATSGSATLGDVGRRELLRALH